MTRGVMPKASVIIPIYNVAPYLEECLNSVVNQTLKDIEIVCVNDGSTDESFDILRNYAKRDDRIVIIDQQNAGQSAARNAAVEIATGDFLYFLDSDDFLDTKALEELYSIARKENLDVLFFDAVVFFESNVAESDYENYKTYYNRNANYPDTMLGSDLFAAMSKNDDYKPAVWMQFISARFYRNAGLYFYEGIVHEDNLFTFLCMLQAGKAKHIARTYYHRRVRANSIMTEAIGEKNIRGYSVCCAEMTRFAFENKFEPEARKVISKRINTTYRNALRLLDKLPKGELQRIYSDTDDIALLFFVEHLKQHHDDLRKNSLENSQLNKDVERRDAKIAQLNSELKKQTEALSQLANSPSYKLGSRIIKILNKRKSLFVRIKRRWRLLWT